jgi:hypothetical protein
MLATCHVQQRQNYMALELGIAVTNTSNKTPDCPSAPRVVPDWMVRAVELLSKIWKTQE